MQIACGQCIGCRLERSRQWAMRIMHEASLYDDNCFITLTYDDEFLPTDQSLVKDDWQKFMKRFRKKYQDKTIRFYMCGEYGTDQDPTSVNTIGRPHYHAVIFNHDFSDKELFSDRDGIKLYGSEELESIWQKGFCSIGDVTFESAAYVARYIMKKITGDEAEQHYSRVEQTTGEITYIHPEFTLMSNRPGIGKPWYEQFKNDMDKGFITVRGKKMMPPKYYSKMYEDDKPFDSDFLKFRTYQRAMDHLHDNTPERLAVKHELKKRKLKLLKRDLNI